VLVRVFVDVDDEVEALVLAEAMRDTAQCNIREGRDGAEEGLLVAVISASGSAREEGGRELC
jgi:hypothetical protein